MDKQICLSHAGEGRRQASARAARPVAAAADSCGLWRVVAVWEDGDRWQSLKFSLSCRARELSKCLAAARRAQMSCQQPAWLLGRLLWPRFTRHPDLDCAADGC